MASTEVAAVPEVRGADGKWLAGRSPNPGGVPRRVQQFLEVMEQHSAPELTRALFQRLRDLALGELTVMRHCMTKEGPVAYEEKLPPDPAFAKLYLDRVYGPVRDANLVPEGFLDDAPDEVLMYIRRKRST